MLVLAQEIYKDLEITCTSDNAFSRYKFYFLTYSLGREELDSYSSEWYVCVSDLLGHILLPLQYVHSTFSWDLMGLDNCFQR